MQEILGAAGICLRPLPFCGKRMADSHRLESNPKLFWRVLGRLVCGGLAFVLAENRAGNEVFAAKPRRATLGPDFVAVSPQSKAVLRCSNKTGAVLLPRTDAPGSIAGPE